MYFISILTFTFIIISLVAVLAYIESRLVNKAGCKILINGDDDKSPTVDAGTNLLSALSSEKIFIPSACGGGGSCAMCKVKVTEGGGDVLPTETPHLSRAERADNVRLSCQVKVKEDMKIEVPSEIFSIKKFECEVVSNYNVASFIKEFVIKLPEGENLEFDAGGYIQIDVPECQINFQDMDISPHPDDPAGPEKFLPEWNKFRLWDLKMVNDEPIYRAYSMANHPAEGNIVMLNVRIATPPWDRKANGWADINPGKCSSYIFGLKPGDKVTVSGPYGDFFIKDTQKEMCYIGGGAGMAPMRSLTSFIYLTLLRLAVRSAFLVWWAFA